MRTLYVIRIDVAYNNDLIVIPHTNKQKALKDYSERIQKWKREWKEEAQFLMDLDHEKEYEFKDSKTGECVTFYFNTVNSGEELLL